MLDGIVDGEELSDAPSFDETRHASICVEVRCWLSELFFPPPLMSSWPAVEVLVRRNHSGSEQPLDYGQFRFG